MAITPADIEQQTFSPSKHGYDTEEVDAFLEQISSEVDAMLEKTADFYDDEVETMSSQLTALLEPLMLVFMGALLGFMIVALYLPMFMIFQSIQNL